MRRDYHRRDAYSIGRETFFLRIPQDQGWGRTRRKKRPRSRAEARFRFLRSQIYFWRRRRLAAPKPMRPRPNSAIVAGSGTDRCSSPDVTPPVVLTTLTPIVNE